MHVKSVFIEKISASSKSTNGLIQWSWWYQMFTIVKQVFVNVSMELVDGGVNIDLSVHNAWKN